MIHLHCAGEAIWSLDERVMDFVISTIWQKVALFTK